MVETPPTVAATPSRPTSGWKRRLHQLAQARLGTSLMLVAAFGLALACFVPRPAIAPHNANKLVRIAEAAVDFDVSRSTWAPDRSQLALEERGGHSVEIWDADRLAPAESFGMPGPIKSAASHASYSFVPTAGLAAYYDGASGRAILQDRAAGQELGFPAAGPTPTILLSPDGARMAWNAPGPAIRIWGVPEKAPLLTLPCESPEWKPACFSPDGSKLAVTGWLAAARIYDVSSGRPLCSLPSGTNDLAFHPAGDRFAALDAGGGIKIRRASDGKPLVQARTRPQTFERLAWSPDGALLVMAGDQGLSPSGMPTGWHSPTNSRSPFPGQ